ncbi:hypothetical protein JW711_00300 [Candidatus Woesearchaeota archaeon]|nr:hypothetical protein [Candidatus Woesearchaeota archaeon]
MNLLEDNVVMIEKSEMGREISFDEYCLRLAYLFAWHNSQDPSTKTGSVLTYNGRVVLKTANVFPLNTILTPERLADNSWRYGNIIHAERGNVERAIALKLRERMGLMEVPRPFTLYSPNDPCEEQCEPAIIQSGLVGEVKTHLELNRYTNKNKLNDKWREGQERAKERFRNAGILYTPISADLSDLGKLLFFRRKAIDFAELYK